MGRFEDASVLLAKTTTDNPDYPSIQNQLGMGLSKLKKYTEAANFFKKAIQADPSLITPYINLGAIYTSLGDHHKPFNTLKKVLRGNPIISKLIII